MKNILVYLSCFLTLMEFPLSAQQITRGPYLQIGTPTGMTIRWRTDMAVIGKVNFGTEIASLPYSVEEIAATTEHIIEITGLSPGTVYYYNVGTPSSVLLEAASGVYFKTSPVAGSREPVRIWAIGDFGNASQGQINVMNSYLSHAGATHTDVWMWLGDNAYGDGTQQEYQDKVFNIYGGLFGRMVAWPCPGNHDYGSINISNSGPYYDIFSLPVNGEAGGEPSGTEGYYSFDYGNVHFISLNSEYLLWTLSSSSAMAEWMKDDLENNTNKDWIIAYWHQPPYTKGSHDSDDALSRMEMMRTYFNPILEEHGVDLVLCGHSHCYERSYMIKGHFGKSGTFSSSMIVDSVPPFVKYVDGGIPNTGTVYAVVGCSGQLSASGSMDHAAMAFSTNIYHGSLVIDIDGMTLTAKFLTALDGIKDEFSIEKKSVFDTTTTSLDDLHRTGEMLVTPNPVNESFRVQFNLMSVTGAIVTLINIKGEQAAVLFEGDVKSGDRKTFSASAYASGIYFIKLTAKDISITTKIVLKR